MEWFVKLQNIDRRIIYVVMLLCLAFPLLNPIGIPVSINRLTQAVYDRMERLESGDVVLFSLDYSPAAQADIHPATQAVAAHLFSKGVRIAFVSFGAPGPMIAEQLILPYEGQGMKYGVDFVNLGFIPGAETAIRNFGQNVVGTAGTCFRGQLTASMPIMAGIGDARDFALVFQLHGQSPGLQEWVRQVQGPLDIELYAASVTVSVPEAMPFVNAGQVKGLLQGLRGAAEYEILTRNPGSAAAGMDAQSLGHLAIIGFILLGNIAYLVEKRFKK